jgi:formylglycine-generating enzyme required for sulfatase activity
MKKLARFWMVLVVCFFISGVGYGVGRTEVVEKISINGVTFHMVIIPAGEFMMGSPENEKGRSNLANESPRHRVKISAFQMGATEVTQGLWKAVMGSNPSKFKNCGDDCPVEEVDFRVKAPVTQVLPPQIRT